MMTIQEQRPTRDELRTTSADSGRRATPGSGTVPRGDGHATGHPGVQGSGSSPLYAPGPSARRRPRKKPGKQIRDDYRTTLLLGLALALAVVLGLTRLDIDTSDAFTVQLDEQEIVEIEEVQQTQQEAAPPPPPRPTPPVEVPNNTIVEQQALDFDASLNLNESLDVSGPPPAPEPPPVEDETEDEIFVAVEEEPVLIGGFASLQDLIEYPKAARNAHIEGRVIVQFVINEEGDVIHPTVVRGRHPLLDKEAVRVVQQARFTPGKQRGEPVKVRMALPVIFRLEKSQ